MPVENRLFPPREFRVSLIGPLVNAQLVPVDSPLPPLAKPRLDGTTAAAPTRTEASNFPEAEIARELAKDRQLIESTLDNLRGILEGIRRDHAGRIDQWHSAILEMSLALASKLLHRQVLQGEFPVENMIRDMSQQLYDDVVVRIRLNPKDLELLERRLDGQPLMSNGTDPQLVADPSLGRAECRVEGQSTMMLADVVSQVKQIREDLLRSLHDARS